MNRLNNKSAWTTPEITVLDATNTFGGRLSGNEATSSTST